MKLNLPVLDRVVLVALIGAVAVAGLLLYWLTSSSDIVVTNTGKATPSPTSALSGQTCAGALRRPIAVMLASDPEARPLSAIGQADMIFEMPVTPNGITRIMAVYQCNHPTEIGSIRSARGDFIPLAQGLDAILVHWGGEKEALTKLNSGLIDNIDALKYEGTTFYRKKGVPMPHNGFSSSVLIAARVEKLGYRASTSLDPYLHQIAPADRNLGGIATTIEVPWPQGMNVKFTYDATTNTYLRSRGGSPEYDASTNTQTRANVVILMHTTATFQSDQYIHVTTIGNGTATIWQHGRRISAFWKKERAQSMLTFTDSQGKPIPFEPGTIWVLIDAPLPTS